MDKLWVKDVQAGQRSTGLFLVAKKQQATGKNGKAFLKLTLQDKTGQLDARVWQDVEAVGPTFEAGDLVEIEGPIDTFQGKPQFTIERLEKKEAPEGLDPAAFEYTAPVETAQPPSRKTGAEGMVQALRAELASVKDPHVRALLLSFIDDPDVANRLRRAPAAKEIHHAYPGGLVEHILSCVGLAQKLADHYPMADRDLLVAGAFLHDIGKIHELSYDKGGTGYTDEGRLVGHLVMTAQWIHEKARSLPGFPKELELHLTHIVLAHHGRLEYGSPKLPHTLEAFLVHELDEIDSRVNSMLSQMGRAPGDRWAEPTKGYERLLWKAPSPTEEGRRKGPPSRQARKGKAEKKKREREGVEPVQAGAARRERQPREEAPRGEAPREERRRQERQPETAVEAGVPRQAERGAEKRGPRILKRAEGAPKAAGGEKLTFKPFSLLTGDEKAEALEGEVTPVPTEISAEAPAPRPEPEAATTETLPTTGPESLAAATDMPAPTSEEKAEEV